MKPEEIQRTFRKLNTCDANWHNTKVYCCWMTGSLWGVCCKWWLSFLMIRPVAVVFHVSLCGFRCTVGKAHQLNSMQAEVRGLEWHSAQQNNTVQYYTCSWINSKSGGFETEDSNSMRLRGRVMSSGWLNKGKTTIFKKVQSDTTLAKIHASYMFYCVMSDKARNTSNVPLRLWPAYIYIYTHRRDIHSFQQGKS